MQSALRKLQFLTWASLHCRAQAGQETRAFSFNQVVNEDAGLDFAYKFTAGKLVKQVRREGGSGCFISLGLSRSGKTFLMQVSMPSLPLATSAHLKKAIAA